MEEGLKVATAKATVWCKDCKHYDRQAVARREPGCSKRKLHVRRKNTCDLFE